jgi:carotenoid cleavage dioxygenase
VRLEGGRATWYRNRWVRSARVADRLGEPRRGRAAPEGLDFAANTHVIAHAGRIFALVESGPPPYELDAELETLGACDLAGGAFTAHPKRDPASGELHAIAYFAGWDHVRHLVLDASGALVRTTPIAVTGTPYMHDFALTESAVVVFDGPVVFAPEALAGGKRLPYAWRDDRPARAGVMPRAGGAVRWLETDPRIASHVLNAYDAGASIVVDLVTLPCGFDLASQRGDGTTRLERWTLDLVRGVVSSRCIDERPQEFPRVNEAVTGRRHRYGYTAMIAAMNEAMMPPERRPVGGFPDALVKHDFARDRAELHVFARGAHAGEAVFAPARSDASASEDDGYVLAFVHDPARDAADLVVLGAQDFGGAPVARVHLPARVPLGFHGSFLPAR